MTTSHSGSQCLTWSELTSYSRFKKTSWWDCIYSLSLNHKLLDFSTLWTRSSVTAGSQTNTHSLSCYISSFVNGSKKRENSFCCCKRVKEQTHTEGDILWDRSKSCGNILTSLICGNLFGLSGWFIFEGCVTHVLRDWRLPQAWQTDLLTRNEHSVTFYLLLKTHAPI